MHTWISPVGTTEKTFHEFANSIRNVPPIGLVFLRLSAKVWALLGLM
jgi:hypothetical protein